MRNESSGRRQVSSEFRIRKDWNVVADNPELELAEPVVSYRFDPRNGEYIVHVLHQKGDCAPRGVDW
jgi:hypothetical protein